jgi:hypothetical protein
MLPVIRPLWAFSRSISEMQSSPAAPGYRQGRHKRKNSRTRWQKPTYKEHPRKRKSQREPGPIHEGSGVRRTIVDERATKEQRDALIALDSGQHGEPYWEKYSVH